MDTFSKIRELAIERLGALPEIVLSPMERMFWLYLASALAVAALTSIFFAISNREEGRRSLNDLGALFSPNIWLHKSSLIDYAIYIVNALVSPLLTLSSMVGGFCVSFIVLWVVVPLFGAPSSTLLESLTRGGGTAQPWFTVSVGAIAGYTFFSLLWIDLGKYLGHFLMHRVSLLWEFHKLHHSAQVLTPVTVYRVHPIEQIVTRFVYGFFIGVATIVGLYAFGRNISPLQLLGVNAGVVVFNMVGSNLRHSHFWLPYPQWLSHILISPAQHQIHHSSLRQHHDRNFGSIFAIWDWLNGTLYVPKGREPLAFGLENAEDEKFLTVSQAYLRPFQTAHRRLLRGKTTTAVTNQDPK